MLRARLAFIEKEHTSAQSLLREVVRQLQEGEVTHQARIYALALQAAGSPDVHFETIKKTPHGVPSTSRGAKRVRNILLDECRPR